jgi:hypothetical protein
MNKPLINFRNAVQAALYNLELAGQISDGCWENSRPWNHWRCMIDATGVAVPGPLGPTFQPRRKYNFNNNLLVEVVGDRMLKIARDAIGKDGEAYGLKQLRADLKDMSNIVNGKVNT